MRADLRTGEEEEDSGAVLRPRQAAASSAANSLNEFDEKGDDDMDNATIIRIVAGVLFVLVLGLLIQRRRSRVK